jgi:hypothetical protein
MSKIRVTWTNVIEIDTDEWREVADGHLPSVGFTDSEIVDDVLKLLDIDDQTPPWARNAIRRVSETVVWK